MTSIKCPWCGEELSADILSRMRDWANVYAVEQAAFTDSSAHCYACDGPITVRAAQACILSTELFSIERRQTEDDDFNG